MRYLRIRHDPEPEVIGVANGTFQLELFFPDNQAGKRLHQLLGKSSVDEFLEVQEVIGDMDFSGVHGRLLKEAKLTDFLVFTPFLFGIPFIVSERVANCLLQYRMDSDNWRLLPVDLEGVDAIFYFLFLPLILEEEIIFSESVVFAGGKMRGKPKTYLSIQSYADYRAALEAHLFVNFERIVLPATYENRTILNIQGVPTPFFAKQVVDDLLNMQASSMVIPSRKIEVAFHQEVEAIR